MEYFHIRRVYGPKKVVARKDKDKPTERKTSTDDTREPSTNDVETDEDYHSDTTESILWSDHSCKFKIYRYPFF